MRRESIEGKNAITNSGNNARKAGNSLEITPADSMLKGQEERADTKAHNDDRITMPTSLNSVEPVVGICCAMGRHRSAAMVESAGKILWRGWQVQLYHRDITKKRTHPGRGYGKKRKGNMDRAKSIINDNFK